MKNARKVYSNLFFQLVIILFVLCVGIFFIRAHIQDSIPYMAPKRIVYGNGASPFVQKVRIVLHEKGMDYDMHSLLPTRIASRLGRNNPEAFTSISPLGQVPAYREGTWGIADSSAICGYLDKKKPTSLFPGKPQEYAQALWYQHYADDVLASVAKVIMYQRFFRQRVLKESPDEAAINQAVDVDLPEMLTYLNGALNEKSGWFVGVDFSIADVSIGVQLLALKRLGVSIDETQWPKLHKFFERFIARPSVQKLELGLT